MSLREIRLYLDLFPEGGSRANSEKRVLVWLEALTLNNQFFLEENPNTPLLYDLHRQGKVDYKLPAQMDGDIGDAWAGETFRDIPRIIENGGGDCDNIACWRAAEYRLRGIAATPYITSRPRPGGGTIYHVIVQMPDGSSEDPCLLIGMAPERTDEVANEQRKLEERVAEEAVNIITGIGSRHGRKALVDVMGWFMRGRGL